MTDGRRRVALEVASRSVAAVLGGLAVAVAAALCLALATPEPGHLGLPLGVLSLIPILTAAMCLGFLARSAWKAWSAYLASALGLAVLAWLLRRGG